MSAKYPRIPHLPASPGRASDDRRLQRVDRLLGIPLIVTEKMDGSNLCFTRGGLYARTHTRAPRHPSFDLAKAAWSEVSRLIPATLSVFGEWMYARHSIAYHGLPGYFLVFGVRDDRSGTWWSWSITGIEDVHIAIVRSYLRAAGKKHGLLLNFGKIPLEIKRVLAS